MSDKRPKYSPQQFFRPAKKIKKHTPEVQKAQQEFKKHPSTPSEDFVSLATAFVKRIEE